MTETAAIIDPELPGLQKPGFAEEALPWMDAVYRFGLRLTAGNTAQAEDLTQDTFLRAYRSWDTYTRGTSCRSWLFTICRNLFLRQRERATRHPEHTETDLDASIEALGAASLSDRARGIDPEQLFFATHLDREVERAVAALPRDFREVVVLGDLEGLSYQEIAAVIHAPLGTVKSRLFRGRRLLAEMLHRYAVELGYLRASPS